MDRQQNKTHEISSIRVSFFNFIEWSRLYLSFVGVRWTVMDSDSDRPTDSDRLRQTCLNMPELNLTDSDGLRWTPMDSEGLGILMISMTPKKF